MSKKIFGNIEWDGVSLLGYIGMLLWAAVILLRHLALPYPPWARLLLGSLPNVGATWAFTMFAKWLIVGTLKKPYTGRAHLLVCIAVLLLAYGSEMVHDRFLGSPFDDSDMIATVLACVVMAGAGLVKRPRSTLE